MAYDDDWEGEEALREQEDANHWKMQRNSSVRKIASVTQSRSDRPGLSLLSAQDEDKAASGAGEEGVHIEKEKTDHELNKLKNCTECRKAAHNVAFFEAFGIVVCNACQKPK